MPAEVISLLSSSPVQATSLEPEKQNDRHVSLAYDTRNSSGRALADPVAGTKRTSSCQAHYERHDDNDFLFLSDDFDTTGDLDGSLCKKPRTSADLLHRSKKHDNSTPPKPKEKPSVVASLPRGPLLPVSMNRWGSVVEDIEFSSSPANFAPSVAVRKAPELPSDPFASSQKEHTSDRTPRRVASESLFCSSPDQHNKNGDHATLNRPPGPRRNQMAKDNYDAQPPSKTAVIDLSSDLIDSPPQRKPHPNPPTMRRKAAWDPISSSAPETYDIQDLLSSPPLAAARPGTRPKATTVSDSSDSSDSGSLPDLDDVNFSKVRATKHSHSVSSRPTARASKQATKKVVKSTEEKEREKSQRTEAREAERERKRAEKTRAREERALEKEKEKALAEVNKLRTDKKVSTPEMIVDIPTSISSPLKVQIEALLGDLNVQHETWNSTVEHVVKWRRKVTSRFDEYLGLWKPTPMRIQDENHILVIVQAAEFVKLVLGEEGQDLEAHVSRIKSEFPGTKVIYLIEGLTAWMRKNRNLLNRQFVSAVRSLGATTEPGPSSNQPRRRNNQLQEYIDEDKIEDALLSLQVLHGTLIHHTNAPLETAQWVAVFTQHISTIPYRKARDASSDAGFCMESGQVRTGDDAKDTYVRMLQEITRITAPVAYGIVAKYESVVDLVHGLEDEGPLALAECRKSANKDGVLTDRTIGPAISKRVHKIFLGRDPTSTDI